MRAALGAVLGGVAAGAALSLPLLLHARTPRLVVPAVDGPLRLRVEFPAPGTPAPEPFGYVIGSVGSGRARLTIDGAPVPVLPNGAFLAFVRTPEGAAPAYRLEASLGERSETRTVPLAPWTERLRADPAAVDPRGPLRVRPGEPVPVVVRAPADARVWVQGPAGAVPLPYDGRTWNANVPLRVLLPGAWVVAARGADTVRVALPRPVVDPAARWAVLRAGAHDAGDGVAVRGVPGGTYRWLLLPGTRVQVTGRRGADVRVRLGGDVEGWMADSLAAPSGPGPGVDRAAAGPVAVSPAAGWTDVEVPLAAPVPFAVREEADALVLDLYGVRAAPSEAVGAGGEWVRDVGAAPGDGGGTRYTVRLAGPVAGYRVLWSGGRLVLRVRRPPPVDGSAPLRGRTVAVDAGHPPGGATGPTGAREDALTLAVATRLAAILRERGARVVLTRPGPEGVELGERVRRANDAGAEALVSLHLDAVAQRMDPRRASGTATHYYQPHARALAREVQAAVVARLGLPDRGVSASNLAMVRPSWFPAVLCEGASLVVPEEEAALRTPEFQDAYARGVADGLEAYFASLAGRAGSLPSTSPAP